MAYSSLYLLTLAPAQRSGVDRAQIPLALRALLHIGRAGARLPQLLHQLLLLLRIRARLRAFGGELGVHGERRRLLDYLKAKDIARYRAIVKELGLRR